MPTTLCDKVLLANNKSTFSGSSFLDLGGDLLVPRSPGDPGISPILRQLI